MITADTVIYALITDVAAFNYFCNVDLSRVPGVGLRQQNYNLKQKKILFQEGSPMAGCRILRDTDMCFRTDKNGNHLLLMVLLTLTSSPSPTASPYKHWKCWWCTLLSNGGWRKHLICMQT